jgi:hypothetical protein
VRLQLLPAPREIANEDGFAAFSHVLRPAVLTLGLGVTMISANKKRVEAKLAFIS